ncbi:NAD(P)/FAD-dependent oxidoreductase [Pacificimonas flava]|uniref:NAD(P)/FAD-dependent oxidoreductase n=1 Tax=Pacificimonas flava TaxID=1234595 RepID=UPI0004B181A1|nr:FAD-binding oxidoreductase [Pacificimonas flava]MBB5279804.1 D-amino-acid dehydrogenase [Pacificimonas flava]
MSKNEHVVVGGGIIGLCIAVALANKGVEVILIDPESGTAASWGNAGHIATEQIAPLASIATLRQVPRRYYGFGGAMDLPPSAWKTWAPFAGRFLRASGRQNFARGQDALRGLMAEALPAWRRLAAALKAEDVLREDGHLVLWEHAATAAAGARAWQSADIGSASVQPAAREDLDRLEALLGHRPPGALRFAGSAQIADLDRLRGRLKSAAMEAGVTFLSGTARLERSGRTVSATVEGRAVAPGARIVVACGIGSREIMGEAGHRAPLIAERGYHVRAQSGGWPSDLPPVVFEDRSMIVTGFEDSVQAASFVEFNSPDAPADARKWDRLERHVSALNLPMSPPFRRWMGARPTLPDYLPAIGVSSRVDGLAYAFGHQHLGLTLGPITAELIADALAGAPETVPLAPFDIDRFH